MSKDKKLSRVDQLLEMAWNTTSPTRAVSIAKQILRFNVRKMEIVYLMQAHEVCHV